MTPHQVVTTDKYESGSPTFSHDGNWLYFLSDRNYQQHQVHLGGDRNIGRVLQ